MKLTGFLAYQRAAGVLAVAAIVGGGVTVAGFATPVAQAAPTAGITISGPAYLAAGPAPGVFRDFDADGAWDVGESGVGGITVTATCVADNGASSSSFDDTYAAAVSTTTAASGAFSLATTGSPCRVEFKIPATMSFLQPGPIGTTSGGFVQFVAATSVIRAGVANPSAFTGGTAPSIVTGRASTGDSNGTVNPSAVTYDALYSINNGLTTATALAQFEDVGSFWGVAYDANTGTTFVSSAMRRHAGMGPGGADAIYGVGGTAGWATPYTATDADGGLIDSNSVRGLATNSTPTDDDEAFTLAGTVAWGDLDISEDGTTLYAVNLSTKTLQPINIATKTGGTPIAINLPTCTNGVARPWALEIHDGLIYVGVVCDASTGTAADLAAFIYAYNPTGATLAFPGGTVASGAWSSNLIEEATPGAAGMQLNYTRGCTYGTTKCAWLPWTDTYSAAAFEGPSWAAMHPSPILSQIEIDDDGALLLGFMDRTGLQFGYRNLRPQSTNQNANIEGVAGGDALRAAAPTSGSTWTLESDGVVALGAGLGGGTITGNTTNNEGPGGGEVYAGDDFGDAASGHHENYLGAFTKAAGASNFFVSQMDPLDTDSGGVSRFPSLVPGPNGNRQATIELYDSTNLDGVGFGKGNGLTDIEMITALAPVEVGNRVWRDDNGNGIQDAGEPPIAGVDVQFVVGANTYTATTDSSGQYLFSSIGGTGKVTVPELAPANYRMTAGDDAVTIRIQNALGGGQQPELAGLVPTEANDATANAANVVGNNSNDSDGVISGTTAQVTLTLGALLTNDSNATAGDSVDREGFNRHTFDFGFTPQVSLGNRVWFDTNNSSTLDAGELKVTGVAVQLFYDANNNGVIDAAEQTPVAYDVTDADGLYFFDQFTNPDGTPTTIVHLMGPGNYVVGIAPSNFSTGGPLVGYHSSGTSMSGVGVRTEAAAADPDNNSNLDDNGTTQTGAFFTNGVLSGPITLTPGDEPAAEESGVYDNNVATVPDSNSNLTVDFGFYTQSFGNVVWVDNGAGGGNDDNGLVDGTEAGINGVNVRLYAADGTTEIPVGPDGKLGTSDDALGGVSTAGGGFYNFSGLPAGTYSAKIVAPAGYVSSSDPADVGTPLATDSDDNGNGTGAGTIASNAFTLTPGSSTNGSSFTSATGSTTNPRVDFGIVQQYDLTIDKTITSSGPYFAGTTVTFQLAVVNNGPASAQDGLTVTDRLPVGLSFKSPAFTVGAQWTCAALVGQEITCTWIGATAGLGNDLLAATLATPAITINAQMDTPAPAVTTSLTNFAKVVPSPSQSLPETNPLGTTNNGYETGDPAVGSNNDDSASLNTTPVLSLGDLVWIDTDKDGQFDIGVESPISGVKVELLTGAGAAATDAQGAPVGSVNTDADGRYSFSNLLASNYRVRFTLPGGYVWTSSNTGGDGLDSDAVFVVNSDATATTNSFALAETPVVDTDTTAARRLVTNPTIDAGVVPVLSLGDLVWIDADQDGQFDVGVESPISGVKVELLTDAGAAATDANGALVPFVNTDPDGRYSFSNLLSGNYRVRFTLPGGYVWTSANTGGDGLDSDAVFAVNSDATATTNSFALTTTPVADSDTSTARRSVTNPTIDAGVVPLLSLGDLVWIDADQDGQFDVGVESPISGVKVELLTGAGVAATDAQGAAVASVNTDADGRYSFSNLLAGDYRVRFTLPSGYVWTSANTGGDGLDSDAVFVNNNSTTATTAAVTLTATAVVDSDTTAARRSVTNPTIDAGVVPVLSLGDLVWIDEDADGQFDAAELPLANVKVELLTSAGAAADDAQGNAIASVNTDANGRYSFGNLLPGNYQVRFTLPSGYVWTSPNTGGDGLDSDAVPVAPDSATATTPTFTLSPTPVVDSDLNPFHKLVTNPTIDAGVVKIVSVGDLVWIDDDQDGVFDATEVPLENVTVTLLDENGDAVLDAYGDPVDPTTTDEFGRYSFEGLLTGQYQVVFTLPTSYVWTGSNVGANNGIDSDAIYTLNSDATATTGVFTLSSTPVTDSDPTGDGLAVTNPTWDAGVIPVLSLGDLFWIDSDQDGLFDQTESGVDGATVTLLDGSGDPVLDANGNAVLPTLTDPDGRYQFTNLVAGVYQVQFTLPSGYVWTTSNVGADNGIDSDAAWTDNDDATASTGTFTLSSSQVIDSDANDLARPVTNPTLDAGVVPIVSIGDLVWIDADRDGQYDQTEAVLADVTVTLLDSAGDPAVDAQGTLVPAVTTDPDGRYSFENLLPGNYQVVFTLPAGYVWTDANLGDDGLDSDAAALTPTSTTASTGVFAVLEPVTESDTNEDARLVTDPTRDAGLVEIVYDLALAKTNVVTGSGDDTTIDYEIVVANQGTVASREFTVVDTIPAGLTVDTSSISDDGVYDADAGTITWSFENLADGDELTVSWSATISDLTLRPYRNYAEVATDSAPTYGDDIEDIDSIPDSNTTNDGDYDQDGVDNEDISEAGVDVDPEDDADIADADVELTYDLALAKVPSATSVNPDGTVTFTITIENQGDVNSNDYTVTDTLPGGTAAIAASDFGAITETTVTWHLSNLAPGATTVVTVTVQIVDVSQRPFTNIAEISADGADDYDAVVEFKGGDVEDVDSEPNTNTGDDNGDVVGDGYGTFENPENDLDDIADVDTLPNGQDDADVAFFDVPVLYDLALVKTGPPTIAGNGTATFTITIKNQGNVDSGNFTVLDSIPTGLRAVSASNGGAIAGAQVTWNLSGLAPGATTAVTVTVQVTDFGTRPWVNFAEISGDGADGYDTDGYEVPGDGDVEDDDSVPDSDISNDVLVDQTALPTDQFNDPTVDEDDHDIAPLDVQIIYDLALVKVLPAGQSFLKDSNITFNIVIKNQGNVNSGPFSVQDVIPLGLTFVSASDLPLSAGQSVAWDLPSLAPGEIKTITLVVKIVDITRPSYVNFAEIVSDGADAYDKPGSDVEDKDSTPDGDISNDPLVDTDDVNIDTIPGDEDDHDRALLDPLKVRSDNPITGTVPATGSDSATLLFGGATLIGVGALALALARRRRQLAVDGAVRA